MYVHACCLHVGREEAQEEAADASLPSRAATPPVNPLGLYLHET